MSIANTQIPLLLKATLIFSSISVYSCALLLYMMTPKTPFKITSPCNYILTLFFLSLVLSLDFLSFYLIETFNTTRNRNPDPENQDTTLLTKDLFHISSLLFGIGMQQLYSVPSSLKCFWSCLVFFMTLFLMLRPRVDYGIIDLCITMLTQFLVYFAKTGNVWFFVGISAVCVGLVLSEKSIWSCYGCSDKSYH